MVHDTETATLTPPAGGALSAAIDLEPKEGQRVTDDGTRDGSNPSHCLPTLKKKRMKASLTLATLNINGRESAHSTATKKWNDIHFLIKDNKIGVLAVQETHMTQRVATMINDLYGKRLLLVSSPHPFNENMAGVAFLINKDLVNVKEVTHTPLVPGRASVVTIKWQDDSPLTLLNVYAPNGAQDNAIFWTTILSKLNLHDLKPDVVLGDLNMVSDPNDRSPPHIDTVRQTLTLHKLMDSFKLQDGWRHRYPDVTDFTYPAKFRPGPKSRIDRIYIHDKFLKQSEGWDLLKTTVDTDHKMATVMLSTAEAPFLGRGRWTLNMAVLKNKTVMGNIASRGRELQAKLENITETGNRSEQTNAQTLYLSFKQDVRKILREASKRILPRLSANISALQLQLNTLLSNKSILHNENSQLEAALLQDRILRLTIERKTGLQENTAVNVTAKNETVSKFWMNLNKEKKPRDILYSLKKPEPNATEDKFERRSDKMAELARNYHEKLQSVYEDTGINETVANDQIFAHLDKTLKSKDRRNLTKDFTVAEIKTALYSSAPGRASGLDGLPYEFWKFLEILHGKNSKTMKPTFDPLQCLAKVYQDIHDHGLIPGSNFAEGWLCPIYKNKGDRRDISNHRPITLLNTDYKILTKIIASRLATTAPRVIHNNQAGFIPGRSIHDQIRLADLMVSFAEAAEENGVIVALDQEKAYDKIDHAYLWRTLRKFKFPDKLVALVQTLYSQAYTNVAINGEMSSPFKITRGVRQGDPMSCLLFDLAIEPLAATLRKSNLRGYQIPNVRDKLITTLFADDTTVYLDEEDDYDDLVHILKLWCTASKAKFNVNKTKIIPIGSPTFRSTVLRQRAWNSKMTPIPTGNLEPDFMPDGVPTRILGAQIGNNITGADIWAPALKKIDHTLRLWAQGHPTLHGKRLIVQMFVGGITQFLSTAHGMPLSVENEVSDMIRRFIWNGSRPKIALEILSKRKSEGGIGLLDLHSRNLAIEIMWLKKFLDLSKHRPLWANVADSLLQRTASKTTGKLDSLAAMNPFIQYWKVATRNNLLPPSLKRMLATSKRFHLTMAPLRLTRKLRRAMPAWFHGGSSGVARKLQNTPAAKCLRSKHAVVTIADLLRMSKRTRKPNVNAPHYQHKNCQCTGCTEDRQQLGCKNPVSCQATAIKLLQTLHPKWSVPIRVNKDDLSLTPNRKANNLTALTDGTETVFNPSVSTTGHMGNLFRIGGTSASSHNQALRTLHGVDIPNGSPYVCLSTKLSNKSDPPSFGMGACFGVDDPRNKALHLHPTVNSATEAWIVSVMAIVQTFPPFNPIRFTNIPAFMVSLICKRALDFEDQNWLNAPSPKLLQTLLANLRQRTAITTFSTIIPLNEPNLADKADELASLALINPAYWTPCMHIPDDFSLTGAKLMALTQRTAYLLVRNTVPPKLRAGTTLNLARLRAHFDEKDDKHIWTALWSSAFTRPVQSFLYKAMHESFSIGKYWDNIPHLSHLAECPSCKALESMEHILLDCSIPGRSILWKSASELLSRKGITTPNLSYGVIMGCGLLSIPKRPGATRLQRIIISETAYLLWKLRCERRVQHVDDEQRWQPTAEILNRWYLAINKRLNSDKQMTHRRFGTKALDRDMVLKTWSGTLHQEHLLPDDWTSWKSRVLVGRGPPDP